MHIKRLQYRSILKLGYDLNKFHTAAHICKSKLEDALKQEIILATGLYHYENLLFLYIELVENDDLMSEEWSKQTQVQAILDYWFSSLEPFLCETYRCTCDDGYLQTLSCRWVHMTPVFYHSTSTQLDLWKRSTLPQEQKGRIAILKDEKIIDYIYHHKAITQEGMLVGDKYQFISIHENILFSYFEEPKNLTNIVNDLTLESEAIGEWLNVIPEDHFCAIQKEVISNFTFIPAVFTLCHQL